ALVLHHASYDPLAYAAGWNRPLRFDPAAYAAALDRWTDSYRRLGIEALAEGVVVIRRRSGARNRVWTQSPSPEDIGPAGEHVLRLFDSHDLLARLGGEDELLAQRFVLAPDHRFVQAVRLAGPAEPEPTIARRSRSSGQCSTRPATRPRRSSGRSRPTASASSARPIRCRSSCGCSRRASDSRP